LNTREFNENISHNSSRDGGEYDFVIIISVSINSN